jgi:hypothetical protein
MIEESIEAWTAAMMSLTGFDHGGTMEVSSKETAGTRVSGQVGTSGNGALERRDVRGAEIAGSLGTSNIPCATGWCGHLHSSYLTKIIRFCS